MTMPTSQEVDATLKLPTDGGERPLALCPAPPSGGAVFQTHRLAARTAEFLLPFRRSPWPRRCGLAGHALQRWRAPSFPDNLQPATGHGDPPWVAPAVAVSSLPPDLGVTGPAVCRYGPAKGPTLRAGQGAGDVNSPLGPGCRSSGKREAPPPPLRRMNGGFPRAAAQLPACGLRSGAALQLHTWTSGERPKCSREPRRLPMN